MNSKKAAFYTLGCKVNQYETEAITELYKNSGYTIVPFSEFADVYVINTCSVTNMGDRKSRQIIRRANNLNSNAVVVVTGCYAQTAADEVLKIDGVNLVIGTKGRTDIVRISEGIDCSSKINMVGDIMHNREFEELKITGYEDRTRAFIKIQEGCSQFCSYCIIPYARGPIRSRHENEILEEITDLAKRGFAEIILVGIHVASYGLDLKNTSLEQLLSKIENIDGIKRLRLSSIEPMTLNSDFVNKIKHSTKLCPHFHISLQSGCDSTLQRMNRRYTTAQYKEIADRLRQAFPDAAITTDIMVGFPGETDEEFEQTLAFVKEINFAEAHVFQYSQRKGTPAAIMENQISPEIKEHRSKIIIDAAKKSHEEFLKKHIGQTMEVLFEQRTKDKMFEGKTANYITVHADSDEKLSGQFRYVRIDEIKNGNLIGTILKTAQSFK